MTADDRRRIREAIDAHQRARRARLIEGGDLFVCSSCGCDSEFRTIGCTTCGDRHRKWKLREDPEYRERMRAYERSRKRRYQSKVATS